MWEYLLAYKFSSSYIIFYEEKDVQENVIHVFLIVRKLELCHVAGWSIN